MVNIKNYLRILQSLQILAYENGLNFDINTRFANSPEPWLSFGIKEEGTDFSGGTYLSEIISIYEFNSDEQNAERIDKIIKKAEEFILSHSCADVIGKYSGLKLDAGAKKLDILLHDPEIFGDNEEHMFVVTCHDGYAEGEGIRLKYPRMDRLTYRDIAEIDTYTGGRITDLGCVTTDDVCLKYAEVEKFGIIDTTNGHNPDLVRRINTKWAEEKEKFQKILVALYDRDLYEIYNADSFAYDKWTSTDIAFADLQSDWDKHAPNYLQHIADDGDLEAILNFVK